MISLRRLGALIKKESLQVVRDPAAILIAFVLPVILLFLFAYAVSLDIRDINIGVVAQSDSAKAQHLAGAFAASRYFRVHPERQRQTAQQQLSAGHIRGYVVIPADFDKRLALARPPYLQVITDGSQPNTANFVAIYAQGVVSQWLGVSPSTELTPRIWYNPELESRRFLVPGAIAIIMTMIGTLLTALVLAREWERGTMEALLATPATVVEILLGKLLPYFLLGLLATAGAALLAITVFKVPLAGSWLSLLVLSAVFLIPALGQGLVISALAKNQFIAAQMALFTGFLPAFLLSGFIFEIDSMPAPIRWLTHIIAARYFIESLQTVFLVGDLWPLFFKDMGAMALIGLAFFTIARLKTHKSLEG
ncbi:ABC transporter permease [Gallaecimonas mangrovi]|uniref:ABC transporter permease n=1 Tax=Gallaecimonas mangrovi TaxID=2291597 RepID=UPI000E2019BB|nr:ABC transporter permease [Gallaecimonas mangrovi]